jgi:D-alanyl-D-alanine carboxypeptidase (penicillin-binding protein 5/6)
MRKFVSFILSVSFFAVQINGSPALAARPAALAITANSAFMMEETQGRVLFEKRGSRKAQPASTVKVLTALVVAERMPLEAVVTVPAAAEAIEPSKVHLKGGERYTVRSLLQALLLASANDAAYTLAVATAGSEARFCELMNERARRLGAKQSHFSTANGLPAENQFTTTRDLTLIMQEAEKKGVLVQIMRQKTAAIYSRSGRKIALRNHNKLLWRDPRDIIGKTGWTRKARHCFVGRMVYARKVFLFAIMGSVRPWHDLVVLLNAFTRSPLMKKKSGEPNAKAVHGKKEIQTALKRAGFYKGVIDGKMGSATRRALCEFQRKKGLKPDGIAGPATLKALAKY